MDRFIELLRLGNFPMGTSVMLCKDGSYCVSIPNTYIQAYSPDPLTALEEALKQYNERKASHENSSNAHPI